MTFIYRLARGAAAMLALAVPCGAAAQDPPVRSVEEILATVPSDEMRARWRAAAAAGELPPLEALPRPRTAPVPRRRATASNQTLAQAPVDTQFPGDARIASGDAGLSYQGPLRLQRSEAGRITVRIPGRPGVVQIEFDLPGSQRFLETATSGTLDSHLVEEVVDNSLRQLISLEDSAGTVLLYVADGSRTPYRRFFPEIPLLLEQQRPDEGGASPLAVQLAGEQFVLRPGERKRVTVGSDTLEIYLGSTYYTDPARIELAEGSPYSVKFMIFRVD